ncbi:hypothetical protein KAR91_32605 [Candidatus Pacearchaeota archaeon]|nr:hypothetical protein [Candidatus Pacearchaeota archaeon]
MIDSLEKVMEVIEAMERFNNKDALIECIEVLAKLALKQQADIKYLKNRNRIGRKLIWQKERR